MRSVVFFVLFLSFIALGVQGAYVRFVNLYDSDALLSISFNETVFVSNDRKFEYYDEYSLIPDGAYNVKLTTDGGGHEDTLSANFDVRGYMTFVAEGDGSMNASLGHYQDSFSRPDVFGGKGLVRFLHGLEGAPAVDVSIGGAKVATNVAFSQMTNYITASEGTFNVTLEAAGETLFFFPLEVVRGIVQTTFVGGKVAKPLKPVTFHTTDHNYQRALVRVIQASPDAPTLTVTVGDVAFNSLSFSTQTSYLEVPGGKQVVNVTGADGKELYSFTTDLTLLQSYTGIISGFVTPPKGNTNALKGQVLQDPASDPNTANIRIGNLVPDASIFLVNFNGKNSTYPFGSVNSTSVSTNDTLVLSVTVYNVTDSLGKRNWRRAFLLGGINTILNTTVTLNPGNTYYILIEGSGTNIKVVADNQPPPPTPTNEGSSGLSSGAIAGIVIGTIFGAILLIGLIVYFYRRANYQSIP